MQSQARASFARSKTYWLAYAAVTFASAPLCAHDYWIERSGDSYTLYQGHVYSSHKGEERVPYDPVLVKRAACARDDGAVASLEFSRAYPVRVSGRCAAVLMEIDSGYWSQTFSETVQKPKTEVRGALRGWRAEESIKRIDAWDPRLAKPLSMGFELVPLEDPLALKPGDKLRVLVTWRGQPKSGVAVAYAGDARGVTGRDGEINVRLRRPGVQVLSASFDEPIEDPNADKVVRGTILQFEMKK
jgi:nickel transport protein